MQKYPSTIAEMVVFNHFESVFRPLSRKLSAIERSVLDRCLFVKRLCDLRCSFSLVRNTSDSLNEILRTPRPKFASRWMQVLAQSKPDADYDLQFDGAENPLEASLHSGQAQVKWFSVVSCLRGDQTHVFFLKQCATSTVSSVVVPNPKGSGTNARQKVQALDLVQTPAK